MMLAAFMALGATTVPKIECKIFLLKDCPIANQFAPEIRRLSSQYAMRGVRFTLVYEDSDITASAAARHATDFRLNLPRVLDPSHALARESSATVSPTAAVVAGGKVLYVGRIDDRFAALGKQRSRPATHDLKEALDSLLGGRPVATPRTQAVGCKLF